MKLAAVLLAIPLAASAWKVTTGYWAGSEPDYCTSANLAKGEEVTVSDLPKNQKVMFFSDDECEKFEFSIAEAGSSELESDIKSFQVMEFEPETKREDLK
ncbi:hypothetical protein ALT_2511 [Aspergillus lentulus]|uniref:Uncharacterized protein n=1 Tax=Aspergillus lentulus TaxID=293939 RepID=A0AAN4PEH9_ASPLE|nr:uncharacterized protein IFM58399_07750 [Aspergillus lentulus]KAF4160225.1 hypothetical protein CNMCM6069_009296 [Aspergillus lentulus]KAF4170048.1 hypothetical protein CNMCM6936_005193 [Aspergillus lentulus]KAF4181830.1 hypothetical protein CNMCM8060_008201 [Aspergillus lentulus]KAF4189780.1 hypothetical protein CNMCM7927_006564 [Aspergillus lentulus]KAF4198126.1 hypothetical protein CNMCM8694_000810 [Aspergillus lentulus]